MESGSVAIPTAEWITDAADLRLACFLQGSKQGEAAKLAGVAVEGDEVIRTLLDTAAEVQVLLIAATAPESLTAAVCVSLSEAGKQSPKEVFSCPPDVLASLRPVQHKPLHALALVSSRRLTMAQWCEMESAVESTSMPLRVLALDGLTDAANVGTLLRLSAAFGISAVLCSDDCCNPYHPKSVRASMGYAFAAPVVSGCLPDMLMHLRTQGVGSMAAIVQDGARFLDEVQTVQHRWALIVGSEHAGIRPSVRDASDMLVKIRMAPDVDSFNVAISAGILLHGCLERESPA